MFYFSDRRYGIVEGLLAGGDISVKEIAQLGKELSELGRLAALSDERNEKLKSIAELIAVEKESAAAGEDGEEMRLLAMEEREATELELTRVEDEIVGALTPKDEADEKGVIIEVRAGTGNAAQLWLMLCSSYFRWCFFFFFPVRWRRGIPFCKRNFQNVPKDRKCKWLEMGRNFSFTK